MTDVSFRKVQQLVIWADNIGTHPDTRYQEPSTEWR